MSIEWIDMENMPVKNSAIILIAVLAVCALPVHCQYGPFYEAFPVAEENNSADQMQQEVSPSVKHSNRQPDRHRWAADPARI